MQGDMKNRDFDQYLALSPKRYKTEPQLLRKATVPELSNGAVSSDLEWFNDTRHRAVYLRQLSFLSRNVVNKCGVFMNATIKPPPHAQISRCNCSRRKKYM